MVTGDRDQLGRIITNLVDNAVRHATSRVTVALATEPASVLKRMRALNWSLYLNLYDILFIVAEKT